MARTIQILVFARLADDLGWRQTSLELDDEAPTVAAAMDRLTALYDPIRAQRDHLAVAVNDAYVSPEHELADGDELALIPPVSGG